MAVRQDQANLILTINGQQSGNTLRDLQKQSRDLRRLLEKIPIGTEEFKKVEAELAAVNAKMKDINDGIKGARQSTGLWGIALAAAGGVLAGLNLSGIIDHLQQWIGSLFGLGTALDTMQAKTRTVFGDAEVVVKGFAETNAKSLGLASQEYVNLATSAGDLLKPMGFTEEAVANLSVALTDQSGILAEWSQGKVDTKGASEILTKSLLGERDALNTLGIDIKDSLIQDELKKKGLGDLTGASKRQAEALITLEQITKQSASANEAFGKNTDSAARRQAELRAKLAEVSQTMAKNLVPVFNTAINVGLALVDWGVRFAKTLAAIPGFVSENRVAIGALVIALLSLNAQGIAAAASALRMAAAQKAATIATEAQAVAQRALNFVLSANPIGLVVAALGVLVAAFAAAYNNSDAFRRVVTGAFAAVTESVKGAIGFFKDLGGGLINLFEGNFQAAVDSFGKAFSRLNPVEVGKGLKQSFVKGYDSVPAPKAEIKADEKDAEQEGGKVGLALSRGFEAQFEELKKSGERGGDALAKGAKQALDLRLKDIEAEFLKEEIVVDRALIKQEITETQHGRRILELQEEKYTRQIEAFQKFHQAESKESLQAQKKLQETQVQIREFTLKEIEATFQQQQLVVDRALFNREITESQHGKRTLELQEQQYQQQIEAFRKFHQDQTREALEAQKKLREIQQQLGPQRVQGVAPLATKQPGQVTSQTADLLTGADVTASVQDNVQLERLVKITEAEQQAELVRLDNQRKALSERLKLLQEEGKEETVEFRQALEARIQIEEQFEQQKRTNQQQSAELSKRIDEKTIQEKFVNILSIEQRNELIRLDLQRNSLNSRLEQLRAAGLQETQVFQDTLAAKLKADEEYQKQKLDNEKRSAEVKKKVEEASYQASADFFALAVDLLGQDEKARKKNAAAIKTFQTAQVVVQGISEVQKIWANAADLGPIAGPIIGAIQTAVAVGRTVLAINKIATAKFAGGGYTGYGLGQPDETGQKPVGVVHEREWVAPRWMVESPVFSRVIWALETVRRRRFAQGGFTDLNQDTGDSPGSNRVIWVFDKVRRRRFADGGFADSNQGAGDSPRSGRVVWVFEKILRSRFADGGFTDSNQSAGDFPASTRVGWTFYRIRRRQFAEGGFTDSKPSGGDSNTFSTTIHAIKSILGVGFENGGFTSPQSWTLPMPAFTPAILALEAVRSRGFADGGFSTTPTPSVTGITLPGVDANMMRAFESLSNEVRGLRQDVRSWNTNLKASVSYLDVEKAGSDLNLVRDDASI